MLSLLLAGTLGACVGWLIATSIEGWRWCPDPEAHEPHEAQHLTDRSTP